MPKRPSIGDRVRVTGRLPNDPDPLAIGDIGTVDWLSSPGSMFQQIGVAWDSGRSLLLLADDPFEILPAYEVDGPVVEECADCGAPGDMDCEPGCENEDFRGAEMDA